MLTVCITPACRESLLGSKFWRYRHFQYRFLNNWVNVECISEKCQLEGTTVGHLVQRLPQAGVLPALMRSAMALSSWSLKTPRDGNPTISLGNLFQCYTPNHFSSLIYNLNLSLLLSSIVWCIWKCHCTCDELNALALPPGFLTEAHRY